MRYLGIDVHSAASVWCLLDAEGQQVEEGKVPTTAPALRSLVERLAAGDELLVGQEVGTLAYFVHDVVAAAKVRILSFNAQQLRMIASSRKKTDRRDAYWIARALQTGMMPHPVYIPTDEVRRLRGLLARREALVRDRRRWVVRARTHLRAAGLKPRRGLRAGTAAVAAVLERPEGADAWLLEALELCGRMEGTLAAELATVEATIRRETKDQAVIERLRTIPAVGERVATTIYACVGDVRRFPTARTLTSYAGLVPSVWQSGQAARTGGITKQGAPALRAVLVQAGHVLMGRCRSPEAEPLRRIVERIHGGRGRRKIAVVAAARHLLRVAFYVWRDGTVYDPSRLSGAADREIPEAA